MPKAPTHPSIVREIRAIHGWNQQQLAKRIGVSAETIKRIEGGTLAPSRRVAIRLFWATGVHYEDILANKPGRPQTYRGPLEHSDLTRRDEAARNLTDAQFDTILDNAYYDDELTLEACREQAPERLDALEAARMLAHEDLRKEFGLERAVEKVRRRQKDPSLVRLNQILKLLPNLSFKQREAVRARLFQLEEGETILAGSSGPA